MDIKRTLTEIEELILLNNLLDIQDWVDEAINGKVNNCKKRMIEEWMPKLYADESQRSTSGLLGLLQAQQQDRVDS